MHSYKCLQCGKEFKAKALNRKFCSPSCSTRYRNLSKAAPHIRRECGWCHKEFWVEPYNKNAKFCCKVCKLAFQRKGHKIIPCASCGSPVRVDWHNRNSVRKFCNITCYLNLIRAKVQTLCAGCGKEMEVFKSRFEYYNNLYCTAECYRKHGLFPSLGFVHNKSYDTLRSRLCNTAEYLKWKSYVLERDNYRCTKCGATEELRVHHKITLYHIAYKYNQSFSIDPLELLKIRESPEFKDTSNGITLCNSCHMKEHHFSPLIW